MFSKLLFLASPFWLAALVSAAPRLPARGDPEGQYARVTRTATLATTSTTTIFGPEATSIQANTATDSQGPRPKPPLSADSAGTGDSAGDKAATSTPGTFRNVLYFTNWYVCQAPNIFQRLFFFRDRFTDISS